jgi:hypothetical protein
MAVKSDLRSLPSTAPTTTHPSILGDTIAAYLLHLRAEEGELAHAGTTSRIRHSWAGACARRLSYHLQGVEESNPPDAESVWSFQMGHRAHELVQSALTWRYGDRAAIEVEVDLGERSCHIDAVLRFERPEGFEVDGVTHLCKVVACEFKSTGGYGWSMQVKSEGPKLAAYLQGCLNAAAVDADLLIVGYATLDRQTRTANTVYGKDRLPLDAIWAEWCYPKAAYLPDAEAEIARMSKAVEWTDAGKSVPRQVPDLPVGAVIVDPSSGRWEQRAAGGESILQSGSTWMCGYCAFQAKCIEDKEAGR